MVRSLLEAREYHLADCRFRNLSPRTLTAYEDAWDNLITWCKNSGLSLTLRSLNAPNVKACAEAIRARERRGKRDNQQAALAFVVNIKVASRFLVDEEILEADFLARVRRPRVTAGVRRPFTTAEIQAIRGALAQNGTAPRDLAMFALSLDTGVRIGEMAAMRTPDLDLSALRIRVMGKGARERVIPFGSAERGGGRTARLLRDYLRCRAEKVPTDRLWLSHDGFPFSDKGWRRVFDNACKEAGLVGRMPHETRHTYATRFLVRHWNEPGAVEALRYNLGHLSDDEYRTYSAEAGRIISDALGRESMFEIIEGERAAAPVRRSR